MADFSVVAGGSGEVDDNARLDWGWLGTMDLAELKRVTRQMIPTFWCGSMLPPATCMAMVAIDRSSGTLGVAADVGEKAEEGPTSQQRFDLVHVSKTTGANPPMMIFERFGID
ncbi:hypothetical protein CFC21_034910 [Triticum aestivum]|uniref:Uncharacterized protein n=3 Tax=Triticum TaxID=4564 RepID=A0A9R0VID1_TRITD|nr:hypothetical protein CFC21_034910 [Triticum aestivum]VAH59563.1 unnamed protein product [Triticum turgidum subsp. durum]